MMVKSKFGRNYIFDYYCRIKVQYSYKMVDGTLGDLLYGEFNELDLLNILLYNELNGKITFKNLKIYLKENFVGKNKISKSLGSNIKLKQLLGTLNGYIKGFNGEKIRKFIIVNIQGEYVSESFITKNMNIVEELGISLVKYGYLD